MTGAACFESRNRRQLVGRRGTRLPLIAKRSARTRCRDQNAIHSKHRATTGSCASECEARHFCENVAAWRASSQTGGHNGGRTGNNVLLCAFAQLPELDHRCLAGIQKPALQPDGLD